MIGLGVAILMGIAIGTAVVVVTLIILIDITRELDKHDEDS